jgi:hypothetical protein
MSAGTVRAALTGRADEGLTCSGRDAADPPSRKRRRLGGGKRQAGRRAYGPQQARVGGAAWCRACFDERPPS